MIHQSLAAVSFLAFALALVTPAGKCFLLGQPQPGSKGRRRVLTLAVVLAGAWGLSFSELTGITHDYIDYTKEWQLVVDGLEPWGPHSPNTYGPLFNALALPFWVDPLLPKVLLNVTWLVTAAFLVGYCVRRGCGWPVTWGVFVLLLFCPYIWAQFPRHGLNDAIPAALCLLAVALVEARQPWAAGLALALGGLFKVYPLLLLPFLVLDCRQLRWQLVVSALLVFAVGMGLSFWIWGRGAAYTFVVNAERPSSFLSVFYSLRTALVQVPLWFGKENLDFLSLPAMAVTGCAVLACGLWYRLPTAAIACAGLTAMLLLYKAGHSQFLVVVAYLVCYWLAVRRTDLSKLPWSLALALLCFWGWLCLIETVYPLTKGFTRPPWDRVHTYLGVPTFLLGAWMVVAILRTAAADQRTEVVPKDEESRALEGEKVCL